MKKEDVSKVYKAAPELVIMAGHMEAPGNATFAAGVARVPRRQAMMLRVLVPENGEIVSL